MKFGGGVGTILGVVTLEIKTLSWTGYTHCKQLLVSLLFGLPYVPVHGYID